MFSLSNVTLKGASRPRLDDLTLTIDSPRTAIVGYSGAGKTSLLNVLTGFEEPDSGVRQVSIPPGEKNHRLPIFWVPENGGLWPHLNVVQHLTAVNSSATQVEEIVSSFDLTHRRDALPSELSHGERSRLSLARAIAARPIAMILDEPLSHVDPVRKPRYWTAVRKFAERDSIALIFSSHEPETVLRHANHVICMHEGKVLFHGPTCVLYESPPNRMVGELLGPLNWFDADDFSSFLGKPITKALANSATAQERRDRVPAENSTHLSQSPLTDENSPEAGLAVRPDRLRLVVDNASEIELIDNPIRSGVFGESTLRHKATDRRLRVTSLLDGECSTAGQRVRLSID